MAICIVSDVREASDDGSLRPARAWPRGERDDPDNTPGRAKFYQDLMAKVPFDNPRRACVFLERCSPRQFEVLWVSVVTDFAMNGGLEVDRVPGLAMLLATIRNSYMKRRGRPTRWGVVSPCKPMNRMSTRSKS